MGFFLETPYRKTTALQNYSRGYCFRKRIRNSSNSVGEAPAQRGEPAHPVSGRRRSTGSVSGHAAWRRVRGGSALDAGPRAL